MELSNELKRMLPPELLPALQGADVTAAEELRLRIGQPMAVVTAAETMRLPRPKIDQRHLEHLLERASGASMHVSGQMLRQGYLYTDSGCRIGFCGTMTGQGLRAPTSANIRIPRAVPNCAEEIADQMLRSGIENTLILSPPGFGKTTLLRDLIRQLSESGIRVSVADERGELAGCSRNGLFFYLGPNTDVMTGGVKAETSMQLLRTMNPQVLAFDEITAPEDLMMIRQAAGCGVALMATAHADSRKAMERRSLYRRLLAEHIFCCAIWIRMQNGMRRYEMERL